MNKFFLLWIFSHISFLLVLIFVIVTETQFLLSKDFIGESVLKATLTTDKLHLNDDNLFDDLISIENVKNLTVCESCLKLMLIRSSLLKENLLLTLCLHFDKIINNELPTSTVNYNKINIDLTKTMTKTRKKFDKAKQWISRTRENDHSLNDQSVSGFVIEFPSSSFIRGQLNKSGYFSGTLTFQIEVHEKLEGVKIHLNQVQDGYFIQLFHQNSKQEFVIENKIEIKKTFWNPLPNENYPTDQSNKQFSRSRRSNYQDDDDSFDGNVFNRRSSGLLCNLCLVVDEQFVQVYGDNQKSNLQLKLERLIGAISWIFRATDWNRDKFPDDIGFNISRFNVGWKPFLDETLQEYTRTKHAMILLSEFATLDFSDCCLGIGFTMRPFQEHQVGITFVASPTLLGGICDHRHPSSGDLTSVNVILVSGSGLQGHPLTSSEIEQVLLHELGHAFGVNKHDNSFEEMDPTSFRQCSGHSDNFVKNPHYSIDFFKKNEPLAGRFIMWGNNQQGKKQIAWNNLNYSPCSKKAIYKILSSQRGYCFLQDSNGYCGNGILEDNESCDCASELECHQKGCCGSRSSGTPCRPVLIVHGDEASGEECETKFVYPLHHSNKTIRKFWAQDDSKYETNVSSITLTNFCLQVLFYLFQFFINFHWE